MSVVGTAQEMKDTGELQFEVGSFSIRRRFRVVCSSVQDDAQVATSAPGLPALFSTYVSPTSANILLRARRYSARRLFPGSLVWVVDVIYETPEVKDQSGHSGGGTGTENDGQYQNPLLELPEVTMHTTEREELLTSIYDFNTGNIRPVTNSAGEVYDPPPKTTVKVLTLEISRNEPVTAGHPALGWQYQNTVNSDAFWGLPPGAWKCSEISAKRCEKQLPGGLTGVYLRVTYKFEARFTWDIVIMDAGRYWIAPQPQAVNSQSNLYVPIGPSAINPFAELQSPYGTSLPSGYTLSQNRFLRRQFRSSEGHPIRGALNGHGGPLPDATTFTVDNLTGKVTVPAPSAQAPGQWVNGLAVQVWNMGGALPTPLQPNTVYYTYNCAADGLTFDLASVPGTRTVAYPAWGNSGSPYANFGGQTRAAYAPQTPPGLSRGLIVTCPSNPSAIPSGTTYLGPSTSFDAQFSNNLGADLAGDVLLFSGSPSLITLTGFGTGVNTIRPLGVFGRIRQFPWVAFAALGLPQSFTQGVQ